MSLFVLVAPTTPDASVVTLHWAGFARNRGHKWSDFPALIVLQLHFELV